MSPTYADLVDRLAQGVLVLTGAWALLLAGALLVDLRTAGRVPALSWVGLPPPLRRTLLAALGVVVAGGLAAPAGAQAWSRQPGAPHSLPVPARPVGAPTSAPTRQAASGAPVVVAPGDTLWSLARARLPAGAGDADVVRAVHRWHARNRPVIGPDPDLIRPGQRLYAPRPIQGEHP